MTVLKKANEGKKIEMSFDDVVYNRYPVKTDIVKEGDNLFLILKKEAGNFLKNKDVILVAESVVSISEGGAFKFSEIKYGKIAKILSHFVSKTPAGIGLGTPQTMQLAIKEVGLLRILFAASVSAVTKLFGMKGLFYKIVGERARGIDGPTSSTLPPYNQYASLIPKNPDIFVREMEEAFKKELDLDLQFIVIDANDIGVNILGARNKEEEVLGKILASDNPLGQGSQSTPFLICRQ